MTQHELLGRIRKDLPATITSSDREEFSCVIDRDALLAAIEHEEGEDAAKVDTFRFRKTMKARRIVRFIDEPKRRICGCGNVALPGGGCDKKSDKDCWNQKPASTFLEAA